MILTYKVKHNRDFTHELNLARKVAEFAIANRNKLSTKYVSHIGLISTISNQVLRKYGFNRKAKKVHSVKLSIKGRHTKIKDGLLYIVPVKLSIPFNEKYEKINSIEIDPTYVFIAVTVKEAKQYKSKVSIGVDMNSSGHCAVVAVKETGKVYKLGKKANHIHNKYKAMRRTLQKQGKYKLVKKIKHRESNIMKDLNHKISRKIIDVAVKAKADIKLENLKGIRKNPVRKNQRYSLHSWSFYQLRTFLTYKAKLAGVPLSFIDPAYTSQVCSKCGLKGQRYQKLFKCPSGHVEHADVNGAFNISYLSQGLAQFQAERDVWKGRTATPKMATYRSNTTMKFN